MADYAGAKAAIRQRLVDNWATTRITFQNELPDDPWPPVGGDGWPAPFVNLEIVTTHSEHYTQGRTGVWLTEGFIYVHVFVPTNSGDALATEYANTIGEIFRGEVFYNSGDGCYVRTWAPRVGAGESGDDEGNYFRVTMSCGFEYWHRGAV